MKYETNLNGNKPKTIKSLILDEKGNPLPLREEPKRDWLTGWVSKKFPKVMEASDAIGRLPNTLNPVKTLQTLLDFTGVPGVINNIAGNPMNLPAHEVEAAMIPVVGGAAKGVKGAEELVEEISKKWDIVNKINAPKNSLTQFNSATPKTTKSIVDEMASSGLIKKSDDGKYIFWEPSGARSAIVVDVEGANIPFYQSTVGTSGKIAGTWYPFFGNPGGGWLIKGGLEGKNSMELGYGIPKIKETMQELNRIFPERDMLTMNYLDLPQREWLRDNSRLLGRGVTPPFEPKFPNIGTNTQYNFSRIGKLIGFDVNKFPFGSDEWTQFEYASEPIFSKLKKKDGGKLVPKHQTGKKIEYTINAKDRLFKQIASESSFNKYAKSGANALGPAQIRKELYMDYVKATKDTEPYESVMDPEKALKVRNWAITRFQNAPWNTPKKGQIPINKLAKAYAAYNWGPGSLVEYLNKAKKNGEDIYKDTTWIHSLPPETKNYLDRVLFDDDPKFLKDLEQFKRKPNEIAKFFMNVKLESGGRIPKYQTGSVIINQGIRKYNSPEEIEKRGFRDRNRRAAEISGRTDYSPIDPITDIVVPYGAVRSLITSKARLVKQLAKEIPKGKLVAKELPHNIGWAPRQKIDVYHASNAPIDKFKFPNPERWDVINHNAPSDIIWFAKGDAPASGLLSKRQIISKYTLDLKKPMIQVGEISSKNKNLNRNVIHKHAQSSNADALILDNIADNQMKNQTVIAKYTPDNINIRISGKKHKLGGVLKHQSGGNILNYQGKSILDFLPGGSRLNFLQPSSGRLPSAIAPPSNKDRRSSEISMSVGGENGEPAYLIPSFKYGKHSNNPRGEFRKTGEHLGGPFKTYQEADDWERQVRHKFVERGKKPIPLMLKPWLIPDKKLAGRRLID